MSRVCSIRGSKVRVGRTIHRSGLAKKKGGIGRHVTQVNKRLVTPNLHVKRIWVPELDKFVKVKLTAKALRTICLLYTSPSPRDKRQSRMPSSA